MKKRLVDAEAWLSQCAHSWMYYNTAKHIIERAPSYEVEEEYLTPIVSGEQAEPAPAPTKADKISRCRACGAEITWIKMPSGKAMPCDAGKVRYRADPAGKESFVTERGSIVRGVSAPDGESWGCISHFKTCPKAEEFRRGR